MRAVALFFFVAVLSIFYLTLAYLALHPRVSREYRAYFIERITSDWNPGRYPATPEEGIRFNIPAWPSFVDYIYGFSRPEEWGRWTDARHGSDVGIVLRNPFTGTVCVATKLMPADSQRGKVIRLRFGDQERTFVPQPGKFSEYIFDFVESKPADSLQFRFEGEVPIQAEFDRRSSDKRRLGLAIMYIRFFPQPCRAIKQSLANKSN